MSETDYIEATNLAKLRIASDVLREVLTNYGVVTEERLRAITAPLSSLVDDCYVAIKTNE